MPDLDFMKTSKRKIRSVPASPKQSPTRGGTSKWVRPSGFLPKNLRKKSADFHIPCPTGSQNNRPQLTSSSPVLNKANCVSSPNTPLNGSRPDLRKLFQNPKTHSENEKSNHQLKKPKIIRESVSDDESYDKIEDSRKNQFLSKEFNSLDPNPFENQADPASNYPLWPPISILTSKAKNILNQNSSAFFLVQMRKFFQSNL